MLLSQAGRGIRGGSGAAAMGSRGACVQVAVPARLVNGVHTGRTRPHLRHIAPEAAQRARLVYKDSPKAHRASAQDGDTTIHVVEWGENMYRIANQYGITTRELANLNGRRRNLHRLSVGTELVVPAPPRRMSILRGAGNVATIALAAVLAGTWAWAVLRVSRVVKDAANVRKMSDVEAEAQATADLLEQKKRWRSVMDGDRDGVTPDGDAEEWEDGEDEGEEMSEVDAAALAVSNRKLRRKFKKFMQDSKQDDSRLSSLDPKGDVYHQPPPEGDLYF